MDKAIQKFFSDIVGGNAEVSPAIATTEQPKVIKPVAKVLKPVAQKNVNSKLTAYIEEELKHGIPKDDIKKSLLAAHWKDKDIDAALGEISSK